MIHPDRRTYRARLWSQPIKAGQLGPAMLNGLAALEGPALLESAARDEQFGRYTILACRPVETLTLRGGKLAGRAGQLPACDDNSFWQTLEQAFGSVKLIGDAQDLACVPGWIGYLGYELGRRIERLPARARHDTLLPDLHLSFYDAILVHDAISGEWSLVELEFDEPPAGAGMGGKALRELAARSLIASSEAKLPNRKPTPPPAIHSNFEPEAYRQAVQKCIDYIAAGDIFQVNLSQRFTLRPSPKPIDLYCTLRRKNPAWYAAYLGLEVQGDQGPTQCAVVSSSPELFLQVRSGKVLTRPIKGTRPRTGDEPADATARKELWESPKDNAELAMIVDLLRNDLGRVCEFGSVVVEESRRLEAHPTVYHLVASVVGTLGKDVGPARLLRATFPGGSITGAPKVRAMEIIDEVEGLARGVYTGCVGMVGVDGNCHWNIAIRTIVCQGDMAMVQVGGGIVADSSPQGEYQETLDKAKALVEAIMETAGSYNILHD